MMNSGRASGSQHNHISLAVPVAPCRLFLKITRAVQAIIHPGGDPVLSAVSSASRQFTDVLRCVHVNGNIQC